MTQRFNFRVAVLLATLLLQPVSGICASATAGTTEPAHPCCPNTPPVSHASAPRCCLVSGVPSEPAAQVELNSTDFVPSAPDQAPAIIAAHPVAGIAPEPAVSRPELFIRFHQFLI
jgi:hypothetical protein